VLQTVDGGGARHSFLLSGGRYLELKVPGAVTTFAHHINNRLQVALAWQDSLGSDHGAVYNATTRTYTTIDDPGSALTSILGISDAQTLTGYFQAPAGTADQGFVAVGSVP
jgi:hypothetical protein